MVNPVARSGTGRSAQFADALIVPQASDFKITFSGTLSIYQNTQLPADVKRQNVSVNRLDAYVRTAPVGQSILVTVYKNAVSIGQVAILSGATSGTLVVAVTVLAGDVITASIDQTGGSTVGETLTVYARSG